MRTNKPDNVVDFAAAKRERADGYAVTEVFIAPPARKRERYRVGDRVAFGGRPHQITGRIVAIEGYDTVDGRSVTSAVIDTKVGLVIRPIDELSLVQYAGTVPMPHHQD